MCKVMGRKSALCVVLVVASFSLSSSVAVGIPQGETPKPAEKPRVQAPAQAPGAAAQPVPAQAPGAGLQPAPAPASTPPAPVTQPSAPGVTSPARSRVPAPTTAQPAVQNLPPGKRTFRPQLPPTNFSPPVLHIEQPDFDWGVALQGEIMKHSFVIENKGGAPLTVTQVKPSCGCTTAAKPDKPIEPGQTGVVTLEIDTKKFSGTIKKTADISSNASTTPMKVSMGGKVDPFFTVEPTAPKIDIVRGAANAEPVKITLKRSAKLPLKVKEVQTEQKVLSAVLKEVQAGEVYEIAVQANLGENQSKYLSEQIHVKLDTEGKEFDIPILVSVSVKDRIDVQPRTSVYFSRNETKQLKDSPGSAPIAKTLDIKSLAGPEHSFKITEVTFENQSPSFETKLETVTEGKAYRLTVSMSKLPADSKSRTVRDTIVIKTDDPTVKDLKVTALAALQ